MDPYSRRPGVREFKTALLNRLEMETPRISATAVSLTKLYCLKYVESYPADRDPCELLHTATALYSLLKHHKADDQKIKAAVRALRNTDRLPWPTDYTNKNDKDILDWLKAVFGFQKDNVANQREHLILLLANLHIRQIPKPDQKPDQKPELDDRALDELMEKLFKNYKKWCTDLNRPASLRLPTIPSQVQQQKLLYVCLYLLVWGEASNLRFMPECLCYIYHHMASDLDGTLAGNPMTGENVKPADEEAFLSEVVSPIYEVIAKEAAWSKEGKAKHSQWRNYDDLNEYFWSVDCFQLGWPMRPDAEFFKLRESENNGDGKIVGGNRRAAKVNFVEIRSYWHVFRSFDRMWSFFILCLQVMILVAWNGDGNLTKMFDSDLFKKVLSVFITSSILNLAQAVLDVLFNWNARHCMSFYVKLRHILKVTLAAAWAVMLPVTYAQTTKGLFGNSSSFIVAVFVYSSPNIVAAVLFLFPFIQHYFESSDYRVVMLMRWWSQPRLYVGRGMQESIFSRFKYMIFWILLIVTKLAFSYYIEIKPLVSPTKALMCVHIDTEVFPQARNNIGVVVALWAPIILVYFMDTQIWYAIFSTLFGGIYGAVRRLGEIQTLEMLRSRFDSLHGLFLSRLIPPEESDQVLQPPLHKEKEAAIFAQLWNEIITSFREEDLINNRERELLLVPYWADTDLNLIQWPPFLLASKIPIALDMVKHCNGEYQELKCRIENDKYMSCAVCESYILFRSVIKSLVHGRLEKE